MPEEITIQTPTLRLAARAWGPADGTPTLALHGWLDNAASFDGIAPRLPGMRLVCLDLPGHGLSEHVGPGQRYPFVDTVAHVYQAVQALGWTQGVSIIGHSLGAAIAAVLAGTFPALVQRLALIEGLGPVTEEPQHVAERLARALDQEERKRDKASPVYATREDVVRRLEGSMSRLSHDAAEILASRGLEPAAGGGWRWRTDPRLRLPSRVRLTEEQVLAFLAAIECPVLLVRGDVGFPFAPKPMSARVAALRDVTTVELPGGHHLHLDTPEPVAAAIAEHFARTPPLA